MADRQQQGFRLTIREAGLRATGPRIAVLATVAGATSPPSHAEIANALIAHDVDRATIFRNLQDLVEADILRRTDLGDRTWRYQLSKGGGAHPADGHPHFVCRECGSVACLSGTAVSVKAPRSAPATVRKGAIEIQLRGLCDGCS